MGEGGYGNRGNDRDFARGSRRPPEASRSIPREEDHARDNPRISSHSNSFVIPNSKKRPADEDWFESGRFPNSKRYGPPLEGENPIANWGNKSWINPKLRAKERRASFSQSPQGRATSSLRDRRSSIDEAVNTPGEHDRGKIQDSHIAPAVPEPPNQSERHIVPEENLYKGQSPQYSDDVLPRMSSNNIVTKNGSMTAASLRLDPDLTNEVDQQRKGSFPLLIEQEMDARKQGRTESWVWSPSISGNATPQSAGMDIKSPSVARSGNQTPLVPALPQSAFPQSYPPNPLQPLQQGEKQDENAPLKNLIQRLSDFSQTVTTIASVTVQRDLAKNKMEKRIGEYERWRPHHESYTSLAEEHEKEMAKAKQATASMDERFKNHEEVREKAIQMMATTMLAAGNGTVVAKPSEDEQIAKHLVTEVKDLKAELDSVKTLLSNVKTSGDENLSRNLERDIENTKVDLNELRSAVTNFKVDVGQLRESQTIQARLDLRVNDLEKQSVSKNNLTAAKLKFQSLIERLDGETINLKERLDSFSGLKPELSRAKARIKDLSDNITIQKESVHELRNELVGEGPTNPGLLEIIGNQESNLTEIGKALTKNTDELQQHDARITNLESLAASTQTQNTLRNQSVEAASRIDKINDAITDIKHEQVMKDELVSDEMEKLSSSIKALQEQAELLRLHFEELMVTDTRDHSQDQEQQSQQFNDVPRTQQPMTPSEIIAIRAQTDAAVKEVVDTTLSDQRATLEEYQKRLATCETFTLALQQRFDNMSTESLARNMVNQMQAMYPHAANAQTEIESIKGNHAAMAQEISRLSAEMPATRERASQIGSGSIDSQQGEILVLKSILAKYTETFNKNAKKVSDQMMIMKKDITNLEELRLRHAGAGYTKETNEEIRKLKGDMGHFKQRLDGYERVSVPEHATMYAQIAALNEKINTPKPGSQTPADTGMSEESEATPLVASRANQGTNGNFIDALAENDTMTPTPQTQVPEPAIVRTHLLTKNDKLKRPREDSDASDAEEARKRTIPSTE